jgi:hypothetical protein
MHVGLDQCECQVGGASLVVDARLMLFMDLHPPLSGKTCAAINCSYMPPKAFVSSYPVVGSRALLLSDIARLVLARWMCLVTL